MKKCYPLEDVLSAVYGEPLQAEGEEAKTKEIKAEKGGWLPEGKLPERDKFAAPVETEGEPESATLKDFLVDRYGKEEADKFNQYLNEEIGINIGAEVPEKGEVSFNYAPIRKLISASSREWGLSDEDIKDTIQDLALKILQPGEFTPPKYDWKTRNPIGLKEAVHRYVVNQAKHIYRRIRGARIGPNSAINMPETEGGDTDWASENLGESQEVVARRLNEKSDSELESRMRRNLVGSVNREEGEPAQGGLPRAKRIMRLMRKYIDEKVVVGRNSDGTPILEGKYFSKEDEQDLMFLSENGPWTASRLLHPDIPREEKNQTPSQTETLDEEYVLMKNKERKLYAKMMRLVLSTKKPDGSPDEEVIEIVRLMDEAKKEQRAKKETIEAEEKTRRETFIKPVNMDEAIASVKADLPEGLSQPRKNRNRKPGPGKDVVYKSDRLYMPFMSQEQSEIVREKLKGLGWEQYGEQRTKGELTSFAYRPNVFQKEPYGPEPRRGEVSTIGPTQVRSRKDVKELLEQTLDEAERGRDDLPESDMEGAAKALLDASEARVKDKKWRVTFGATEEPDPNKTVALGMNYFFDNTIPAVQSMKKAWQRFQERRGRGFWKDIREGARLPFWSEKFHSLASKMLDVEGRGSQATERMFSLAEPYFNLKDKDKVHRVMEIEDEVGARMEVSPTVQEKMRAENLTLTAEERAAHKGVRDALDYLIKVHVPKLMVKGGASQAEVDEFIRSHYREGYLPHRRYGDLALAFTIDPSKFPDRARRYKKELRFFETEMERDAFKKQLLANGNEIHMLNGKTIPIVAPDGEFRVSEIVGDASAFSDFLSSWPIVSRMMRKRLEPEDLKYIDSIEKRVDAKMSEIAIGGRMAHRKDKPGWSRDYERSLKEYFTKVPFAMTKRLMRGEIENEIEKHGNQTDRQYARRMFDFWSGASHREGVGTRAARRIIYNYYLAAKPSFFLQNITQRWLTTFPDALQQAHAAGGGIREAHRAVLEAQKKELRFYKDIIEARFVEHSSSKPEDIINRASYFNETEKKVLIDLLHRGELGSMRVEEATGRTLVQARMPKYNQPGQWGKGFMDAIEAFGTLSEKSNRLHAALSSFELNRNKGLDADGLMNEAMEMVRRTQFAFSKATRQQMARGGVQSSLFVFKSFMSNYLMGFLPYLYKRDKSAMMLSIGIFAGLAGAAGMPGYALMRRTILPDAMVKLGLARNDEEADMKLQDFENKMNKKTAGVIMKGFPALVDIDGAAWFGFAEPYKITPFSMIENVKSSRGPWGEQGKMEKLARLAPTSVKHWIRNNLMNETGEFSVNRWGAPLITDEDIKRMPREVRGWMTKAFGEVPTVGGMSDWGRALYMPLMVPEEDVSAYYENIGTMRRVNKGVIEAKTRENQEIADIFMRYMDNPTLARRLETIQPATFQRGFWRIVQSLSPDATQEMRDAMAEIKKSGYEINMGSILNNIRERLHTYRWKNR